MATTRFCLEMAVILFTAARVMTRFPVVLEWIPSTAKAETTQSIQVRMVPSFFLVMVTILSKALTRTTGLNQALATTR